MACRRDKIILSDFERDALIIQSVKEGFVKYLPRTTGSSEEKYSLLLNDSKLSQRKINNAMQKIYPNIILFDELIMPSVSGYSFETEILESNGLFKIGEYDKYGIQNDKLLFGDTRLIDIDDEYAYQIKPIIMKILLRVYRKRDTELHLATMKEVEKQRLTLPKYLDFMYDFIINRKQFFCDIRPSDYLSMICECEDGEFINPPRVEYNVIKFIIYFINTLVYKLEKSAKDEAVIAGDDFDLQCFCDYGTKYDYIQKNMSNDCYGLLKIELPDCFKNMPKFNSIAEVLTYRDKKWHDIKRLRNVLAEMEYYIRSGMKDAAINKARNDIEKAVKDMKFNDNYESISRWTTLISLPIGILELYMNSSLIGMSITVLSFLMQIKSDINKRNSEWLYLIK